VGVNEVWRLRAHGCEWDAGTYRKRRSRTPARVVITIALVVVLLVTPASVKAGGNTKCGCACLQCGVCPTPYTLTLSSTVLTNSTDSTVFYELSTSSSWSTAFTNLTWGNSTSYVFTAGTYQLTGENGWNVFFLNYLEPSTTYYYKVVGYASCSDSSGNHMYRGTDTGSWKTGQDSLDVISGTVYNSTGSTGPANLNVEATCGNPIHWTGEGLTNSHGQYTLISNGGGPQVCGTLPITVSVENWVDPGYQSIVWSGQWNETMVVWAPQVMNFNLAANYKTYVPSSVEFVHSSDAEISSYSTQIYTTTENTWSYAGNGGSTSESSQAAWGTTVPAGDSLLTDTEWWTSGTAIFNAINNRQATLGGLQYFDQTGVSFNVNGWTDWQTSQPSSGFCEKFNSASSIFTLTLSGSDTIASGYDFDVGVSAGPASASVPIQNVLESTSGFTTQVTFTLTNPNSGSYAYFLINTEGGGSSSSNQAIVAHVWLVSSC